MVTTGVVKNKFGLLGDVKDGKGKPVVTLDMNSIGSKKLTPMTFANRKPRNGDVEMTEVKEF